MTIRQQGGVFGRNPSFNKVGIGIDDHSADLTVTNGAAGGVLSIGSDPSDIALRILQFGESNNYSIQCNANSYLRFHAGGSEAARFNPSGNLAFVAGKGIDFSATSGTGTSELFDDYEEGTWTPTFSAEFTTAPTITSAQYTKIGRQVTVTMLASDGVVTAGGSIGGLPFASNASQGAGAYGGNSDTTESLQGTVGQSASSITNIPARTLTGDTWQITATYFTT